MAILSSDPYQAAWQVIGMILVSLLLLGVLGLLFIKFIYPYLPRNVLEIIKEFFTDLITDFGLGLGWAALYFSVLTAWFNGQTIGKRLLGIQVV